MNKYCPFCNSTKIDFIDKENNWYCRHCGESFDKPNKSPYFRVNHEILEKIVNNIPFCSEVCKGNGKYADSEYDKIYERDNYTCQLCGVTESLNTKLIIHHIIPLPYGDSKKENLILLCTKCHRFIHSLLRLKGYGEDKGYVTLSDIREEIEKKEHPSNSMTNEEKRELLLNMDREGKIKLPDKKVTELIREELIEKEGFVRR